MLRICLMTKAWQQRYKASLSSFDVDKAAHQVFTRMNSSALFSDTLSYFEKGDGISIPYRKTEGKTPGVIFIPGFLSNMTGQKADALEKSCKQSGHSFVRFDYVGLGSSKADLPSINMVIKPWYSDALTVLDKLTEGPQIIVGSSFGALLMLLLAMDRPHRIHALVGVASAYRFSDLIPINPSFLKVGSSLPKQDHTSSLEMMGQDVIDRLTSTPLAINCPIRLLHGMQDDIVAYQCSLDLASAVQSSDVDIYLRKSADHRFSHPEDVQFVVAKVSELLGYEIKREEQKASL